MVIDNTDLIYSRLSLSLLLTNGCVKDGEATRNAWASTSVIKTLNLKSLLSSKLITRKNFIFFAQGRFFVLDRGLLMGDPISFYMLGGN